MDWRRVFAQVEVTFSNSVIEAFGRSTKQSWIYLHSLDTAAALRRLVDFYVTAHNEVMPHSAFEGQAPDELYFGTGGSVAINLAIARQAAREERMKVNRAVWCRCLGERSKGVAVTTATVQNVMRRSGEESRRTMDHNSPIGYEFDEYLRELEGNWFEEDALLLTWLARSGLGEETLEWLRDFGAAAAGRFRARADVVERRENLPFVVERGPFNRTDAEVILPPETRQSLAEIHGSGLWKADLDERARYAAIYLLNQNGEAGVTCSTACSDGLVRALRTHGSDARSREVVQQMEDANPDCWIHGAQFVTEIQGGSDAATNAVRAEPLADGLWSLTGQKWFCSNCTADYWLVTGRVSGAPGGHRGVALFCVPRLFEGQTNGHRILRLKDKLGTRALPTAEIDLEGAVGWPVGSLDHGLKNMVSTVLVTSRIHNVVAAAGFGRRASREAHAYANFRHAFGRRLCEHPLLAASLDRLSETADRTAAGAFATVDAWVESLERPDDADLAIWARVLVSISKAITTRRAPSHVYEAMMVFGGNGIEERFCALPRLWRDAAILETWEGPYTLLLMQALGDLVKFGVKGRERSFLEFGLRDHLAKDDAQDLAEVLAASNETEAALRWGELAPKIYERFEARALDELLARSL